MQSWLLQILTQATILALVLMVTRIDAEPQQGQAYLPPSGGAAPAPAPGPKPAGPHPGHPDEWAGDPVNYEFSYEVQDAGAGLDFGHHEMRNEEAATGSYHVLLPDGRHQYVDYIADENGYRPMIRYEGTASYPAAAPSPSGGGGGAPAAEGYKYRRRK
ncbi:hypothetical protein QAD02_017768 [Eretmocerus hayati]|uniref:Uncharacterized protein n=1 Tax=Eretmocerus hayati TaxID=131215 RepID=A0ACC2PG36_9HYME|nr:hypothetical protein QAD02_017768 [Eretmocerus hayati]